MSQSYRLLSEGMPEPDGTGVDPFPADVRKTIQWVAALPRANATGTRHMLAQALGSLNRQHLDGSQRLAVLEHLRVAVAESISLLKRDYAGSALPLAPAKALAASQVDAFHLALAQGYRRAAVEFCAPAGSVPLFRGGSVSLALVRSTWHYSQALALAWRVYRAPSAGVWQGLHRVHRFSLESKLDNRRVEDPVSGSWIEVHSLYLQSVLTAVTHPLAFSQAEQDALWQATSGFAARCTLLHNVPKFNAPVVPEDADRGPGPGVLGEPPIQWLDMTPFCEEIDAALARQKEGFSEIPSANGGRIRMSVDMLHRLKRSFGLASARSHKRLAASHGLRTVFGLNGLHFYLAGQHDFETFISRAAPQLAREPDHGARAAPDTDAARAPVHEAKVLDQSLGGYRMAWEHADRIRARVGELVGLSFAGANESREWMLGVIRWLRFENNGSLTAGVELLSRRARAVGLRVHGTEGAIAEPVRALEMEVLDGGIEVNYLAPGGLDCGATRIEVVRDHRATGEVGEFAVEEILAGVDVLLNAGDYALLRPLRSDLVAVAEGAESP